MQGSLDKGLENGGFGRLLGNEAVFLFFFDITGTYVTSYYFLRPPFSAATNYQRRCANVPSQSKQLRSTP